MINVLGDALAAGIMAHICRKNFIQENDEVGKLFLYSFQILFNSADLFNQLIILFNIDCLIIDLGGKKKHMYNPWIHSTE